jgi:hypothetical protein
MTRTFTRHLACHTRVGAVLPDRCERPWRRGSFGKEGDRISAGGITERAADGLPEGACARS